MNFAAKALLAFALSAASTLASAQVFQFDGRYYEVVLSDGISWAQANAAASSRPHPAGLNIQGQLATIASPQEELEIRARMPAPQGARNEVWLGGKKGGCGSLSGCFGRWINGGLVLGQEGGLILDHDNVDPPPEGFTRDNPYTNWQTGQPDDSNDQTVAYGPGADGLFGIDNQSKTNAILGYVVEWGVNYTPQSGQLCLTTGCNLPEGTVPGSIYKFPANTIVEGKQVDVSSWVVSLPDDASRCGLPDSNFNKQVDAGEGTPKSIDLDGNGQPDVILSGFTCALPGVDEVVIFHTASDVKPNGAVQVENFTNNLLPTAYPCHSQIPRNWPPTHEAVGLWQTDLVADMAEMESTESTFACGTDRLKGGRGSYWVVGASINCGDADEYTCFLEVMLYKLHWAQVVVEQAIAAGVVSSGDGNKMRNEIITATGDLTNGNINECKKHIVNFNKFARSAKYNTAASPINFSALFEMRGDNLLWTVNKLTAAKQFVAQ